ncbi:MAG: SH3 domain-containing protein, partial [Clostridia bacterium]|nr:SH3 domain-containing protein [Clostridia bacterium]
NVVSSRVYAAQSIEGYSSSKISRYPGYQALIDKLKSKYPSWNFKMLYTGLDWNQVIKNETTASHGRNLVYSDKSGAWVCSTCGNKSYDTGKWRCASEVAVSYYMDPRNWINEDYIFQFEDLSYDANTQTLNGVQKILSSAAWANGSSIKYTRTDGTQGTINKSYAQVVMDASKEAGISPYHLASRIVLEQGKNSTPGSTARGTYTGYQGYYNFCNVNASGNTTATVISNALTYAKNNGWTDPEASIKGGAKFIAKSYIAVGQSTLYLQKYDVDNSDGKLYYHQYMANVSAAATECVSVKNSYSSLGMLNNSYTFLIPVYENMPNEVCASPDSTSIVTQNVKITGSNVQVRNSPSLIGTVVDKLNVGDMVLRIECAASQKDGYYWDKIVLKSGAKAYIARNYISQVGDVTNCNVSGVANTSVNLRNGPGTTGTTIVTTLISGQAVTIIEKDVYNNLNGYNWVRVKLSNGTQGYIASQYITEVSGGNTNPNYKIATIVCEDGSSVRIRSGATTQGSIVTTLKKGATVTIMQENAAQANGYTWDKIVTSDGLEGYVANKYLNKGNNAHTQAPEVGKISGDVNGSDKLDAGDYVLIKNHIMEVKILTDAQKRLADYNGDGKVNASDYILIKNKLME